MDSFSNVLEGARQYFQGLPSPAGSSSYQTPQSGSNVNEPANSSSPRYSNPDTGTVGSTPPHYENIGSHRSGVVAAGSQQPSTASALPLQQQQQPQNVATAASSTSSTVLSYWPPASANSVYQRTKDVPGPLPSQAQHPYAPSKVPAVSSASQSASHTVYNGSRLTIPEPRTMNYQHQNHMQQQQQPRPQGHNLPPIAALSNYHSSRNARESTHRMSHHHTQSQQIPPQQISNKLAVGNSTNLLRTQPEYVSQVQQNHTPQYSSASNSSVAVGNGSVSAMQFGLHRSPKYQQQQQQLGATPPTSTSYGNYTSQQTVQQQQTVSTSISSSPATSSSGYQSSLHPTQQQQQQQQQQHHQQQQQQQQQQYQYHHPHHTQTGSTLSVQPEQHMKPDQHQQTLSSKRQYTSQQQAYYNPSAPGRPQPAVVPSLNTSVIANGHQRSISQSTSSTTSSTAATAIRTGRNKRESPLDLSVKTVRQSADSTAKDDMESSYGVSSYSPAAVDHQSRGKTGIASIRSRTPQQGAVPMPLQLPSSVAYPTFDTRGTRPTSSNTPSSAGTVGTTPGIGAPKVNFLPNFVVSQHNSTTPANCVSESRQHSSGRTNSIHHQMYTQPSTVTPLPHVASFKKNPSTAVTPLLESYEQKQTAYYNTSISQTQHRHSNNNSSSGSTMLPPYTASSNNHYSAANYEGARKVTDPMQNYGANRLMDMQNRGSNQTNASYTAAVTLGQKRGSDARHPSPAKVPRLDTWKQTIDQQIEQRFSSYTMSKQQQQQQQPQHSVNQQQQQVNGNLDSSRLDSQFQSTHQHHHRQSLLHHQSQQPNHQHHQSGHPRSTAPAAAAAAAAVATTNQAQHSYHSTQQSSHYVPSPGHQQYQTPHVGSQPMTQVAPPSRSHSLQRLLTTANTGLPQQQQQQQQPESRSNSAVATGGMPDKRVISILRSSLEIKEARMTELQNRLQQNQLQQQQAMQNRQASAQYQQLNQQPNHQQPSLPESPAQIMTHRKPSPAPTLPGRHNLAPFGVALETNSSQQAHKIHVPKAVESVMPFDAETEGVAPRMSSSNTQAIGRAELPENNHNVPLSSSSSTSGDPDGVTAYLLARIRTKAELKQVGPSLEQLSVSQQQFRCPTPASSVVSASNSSVHSPRTTPGTPVVFSPPPQPVQAAADTGSEGLLAQMQEAKSSERTPSSNGQSQSAQSGSGASSSGGSPPKLTRERVAFPPRRRLFSRPDEEPGGGGNGGSGSLLPPRDSSGLRSSSETSVFDFRDSDSEGEMPVLEMQTLGEMRRDRKSHTKHQAQATSISVPEVIELSEEGVADTSATTTEVCKEVEPRPVSPLDPLWSATCDKFLEQLQKGGAKRTFRRKKTVAELKVIPDKVDDRSESNEMKVDTTEDEKKEEKVEKIEKGEKVVEVVESKVEVKQDVKEEQEKNKSEKKKSEKIMAKEKAKSEDSDEDLPLIRRRGRPKKKESSDGDVEDEISLAEIKARLGRADKSAAVITETPKIVRSRSSSSSHGSNPSSSIASSDEEEDEDDDSDSHEETVAERLRRRKQQDKEANAEEGGESIGMRLRSKAPNTPQKSSGEKEKSSESTGKSSSKKKKPQFGDGSDFRPGWEEEVYRFKRSLRMPPRLINIPRPPHTHRLSASLPDLDPYPNSPAASTVDSADFSPQRRNLSRPGGSLDRRQGNWNYLLDSDLDSSSNLSAPLHHGRRVDDLGVDSEEATSSTTVSSKLKNNGNNDNNNSILNLLVRKYTHSKSPRKKSHEKNLLSERSGPRTIPRSSSGPELLATPSLGIGISKKPPSSKADNKKINLQAKKHKSKKLTKDSKSGEKVSVCDIKESVYLGYFRKKTVTNFRDAFRQNGGILAENFAPVVFKTRTRTQTRVLRQRATIREVFGEDRPASAPPTCPEERVDIERSVVTEGKRKSEKEDSGSVGKNKSCVPTGGRPGLRSAGLRRSNKAVLNSKRRLLRRDHGLLRAIASKKLTGKESSKGLEAGEPIVLLPPISREGSVTKASTTTSSSPPSSTSQQMEDGMVPPNGKRIKLRSVRRKFRSGFDYIRKKKKQQKREGDTENTKEKKKSILPRPSSESVQDIQTEIRGWVINKGLGETLLHRAARLGYTDVAAYCLEKLDNPPSPRDNAGYTPLHEACSRGHLEIARLLLMYGANVSDSALGGIRPLHEAAENGFTELIRLLLSYGADPLLSTYSGYSPLSLTTDDEARRLLQQHLADVQGHPAPPWTFQGPATCCDSPENGYDPLADPPCSSPEPPEENDIEMESSELQLPVLYRLRCEPGERWVLLQDLTQLLRIKSRDALLRQLNAEAKSVLREFKMADFLEQARSCHVVGCGEKINIRASKVALVKYNEKVKQLLGVEKVTISCR